jgi:hypothetical protein
MKKEKESYGKFVYLRKVRHDVVDYYTECGGVVVPSLDKITICGCVLHEGCEFVSVIFGDQISSVTSTAGS